MSFLSSNASAPNSATSVLFTCEWEGGGGSHDEDVGGEFLMHVQQNQSWLTLIE